MFFSPFGNDHLKPATGKWKKQDQCTVKLVNLPPIPSLPIASVHICYFFCKNNATYLRGIPCLQGNYCISMYFEEVESFLKQWSYKKDKSKAELDYRMFIFPHLCIYIYLYIIRSYHLSGLWGLMSTCIMYPEDLFQAYYIITHTKKRQ